MWEVNVHTSILCWFSVFFFITPGKQAELPSDVQVKCSCRLLYIIRVSNNSREERWEPCTCGCMDTHLSSAAAPQKLVAAAFVEFIAQCEEIKLWVTLLCMISTNVFLQTPPSFQWQICPKTFSDTIFVAHLPNTAFVAEHTATCCSYVTGRYLLCSRRDIWHSPATVSIAFALPLREGSKQWLPRCVAAWISGPGPVSTV